MPRGILFTGLLSPAFEDSFLGEIAAATLRAPLDPIDVLVGSNLLGIHLRRKLAQRCGGHANIRFLTFVDLADRLRRSENGFTPPFPAGVEELFIAEVCANEIKPSSPFYAVRNQRGFHQALKSTFHDLLDGGLTSVPSLSPKIDEIGRLFTKHRNRYQPHFATAADRLTDGLSGTDFPKQMYLYGFYDLTEIQRRLLKVCANATTLRAWVPRSIVTPAFLARTIHFFEELCGPANEVSSTEQHCDLDIFACAGERQEAEEVVRKILSQTTENKVALDRIGILVRDSTYIPIFADVLEQANIPFYREGGTPILETRFGKGMTLLLRLLPSEWSRTEMIELLSILPFSTPVIENAGSPADWDGWTRQAGVTLGAESFLSKLAPLSKNSPHVRSFIQFLQRWFEELDTLKRNSNAWATFAQRFSSFLKRYFEPTPAVAVVEEGIAALSRLDSTPVEANFSRICALIQAQLKRGSIVDTKFQRDGLFLGSIVSARAIPFDWVVVPGLAERRFPAPSVSDPILLDSERSQINEQTRGGIAYKGGRFEEERVLFELATLSARKHLIFSYSRLDSSQNRELFPSIFLRNFPSEVKRPPLFSWLQKSEGFLLDAKDWLKTEIGHRALSRPKQAEQELAEWSALGSAVSRWVASRLGSNHWTSFDGLVKPMNNEKVFTPTQISTFALCPHRYFLRYVLNLFPHEDPDRMEYLSSLSRGTLMHEILFQFYKKLKAEKLLPLEKNQLVTLENLLLEIAEKVLHSAHPDRVNSAVWEADRHFLIEDLKALLAHEFREKSPFVPEDFERSFGPIEFPLGKESISVQGRIDRIDYALDRKSARVVDYKTRVQGKEDQFKGGEAIALPLYLAALEKIEPQLDVAASHGVLMSSSAREGFSQVSFSGSTLQARNEEFLTILKTFFTSQRDGQFPPRPGRHCDTCDYLQVCSKTVSAIFDRKREDPACADLFALEEIE